MNKQPVITAKDIEIKFQLHAKNGGISIKDIFSSMVTRKKFLLALNKISFEIREGDIFYIIGRNGAGKSTLLKVLADTLTPDDGSIWTKPGLTKSFISMGLGFQGSLSGYQNIDIALKIIGFPKKDMFRIKKEIVEFTHLKDFLREPINTYSAGMKARLAFSIATCNTPDILIMDEVIGAGDEEFRERCQNRLDKMIKSAKAIIVSTHSMKNTRAMATRALWLEKGNIMALGEPDEVIKKYQEFVKIIREDPLYDLKHSSVIKK